MNDEFTQETLDRIIDAIWHGLDTDPYRFNIMLADLVGFVGAIALATPGGQVGEILRNRAAAKLFDLEERALTGKKAP